MNKNYKHAFKAAVIVCLTAFTLIAPHIVSAQSAMPHMEHVSSGTAQCKNICSSGIPATQKIAIRRENKEEDKSSDPPFSSNVSLSSAAGSFHVKVLHLQSSWLPPDRVLLFGHYSDGL